MKYSVPYGNNRNIHIFSTLDDCNEYITNCKKIIIHNLLSYYKTKISQYTTTVNKIESKIDDFLSNIYIIFLINFEVLLKYWLILIKLQF